MRPCSCLWRNRRCAVWQQASGLQRRCPVAAIRTLASDASDSHPRTWRPAAPTEAAPPEEKAGSSSPFKQHRREELWQDRQREDPLYPDPYPRLESSAERRSVSEFMELFEEHKHRLDSTTILVGRVRSKRVVGQALIFLDVVNEFQRVQVMLNKNKCLPGPDCNRRHTFQKFALFRHLIQVGDHISVAGIPVRTDTGQPTLQASELPKLLSPAMEQIPEKLTDPKRRMQERYVDMLVNREAVDILRLRAEITRHMRSHFHSKRFLELQTPILAANAGGAAARPFVTRATELQDKDLALRVAPELWLKRLVVGGFDKVFEIGPAFRNEGVDATHNPEFTVCEFYSAYSNLADLINETEELIYGLAQCCQGLISTQLTRLPSIDLARYARPFAQIEFIPALEQALGIRLPNLSADGALPEMLAILRLAGIELPGGTPGSLPKLLDRLAAMYLEPAALQQPLFIVNHPACMSPLAKSFVCSKTFQLVSARAELFVGGRELANMYEEENDPELQKRKLAEHRRLFNRPDGKVDLRAAADPEPQPELSAADADVAVASVDEAEVVDHEDEDWPAFGLDDSYTRALDYGLPPTGGWGCGVDRLVMLFSGANRISDCLSFGTLRNVFGLAADKAAVKTEQETDATAPTEGDIEASPLRRRRANKTRSHDGEAKEKRGRAAVAEPPTSDAESQSRDGKTPHEDTRT